MKAAIVCGPTEEAVSPALELLLGSGLRASSDVKDSEPGGTAVHVVSVPADDRKLSLDTIWGQLNGGGAGLVDCPSCGAVTVEFAARPVASPSSAALGSVVNAIAEKVYGGGAPYLCLKCQYTWR